jgi:hypothetical protein
MYEQSKGSRQLKKLSFVWIERDPNVMQEVDVVRRHSTARLEVPPLGDDCGSLQDRQQGIASTLLALVPASRVTDEELEEEYPSAEFRDLDVDDRSTHTIFSSLFKRHAERNVADDHTIDQSFLDEAYNPRHADPSQVLDLQVYLTTKTRSPVVGLPFVRLGRPDIKEIFAQMREQALQQGERRVAVCVCAPKRLIIICQKACIKHSDHHVQFDLHSEVF